MKKYIVCAKYKLFGYRSMASGQERTKSIERRFDNEKEVEIWLEENQTIDDGTWYGRMCSYKIYNVNLVKKSIVRYKQIKEVKKDCLGIILE